MRNIFNLTILLLFFTSPQALAQLDSIRHELDLVLGIKEATTGVSILSHDGKDT